MSLHALADYMASYGRNGDTMLVHMTPDEVHGLHRLALTMGERVTINPVTGLPEMSRLSKTLKKIGKGLKKALPAIAGFALNTIAPGVGSAIGTALGTSAAVGTGIAVGGISALATGSLSRGLTAGLGAYGGAALGEGMMGAGAGAAQKAAIAGLPEGATQAEINMAAANATKNYLGTAGALAPVSIGDRLISGAGAVLSNPSAFAAGMGGWNKVLQAGYAAAAPAILSPESGGGGTNEMPQSVGTPAYYRPYEYDPETKGLRSLGTLDAAKVNATQIAPMPAPIRTPVETVTPMPGQPARMAGGGIVAFADGGINTPFGLGNNPQVSAAPATASGGISDLVYQPLSKVSPSFAAQGGAKDPLNDRQQGLERVLIDMGLQDEMNRYGVNVGNYGSEYKPVKTTVPVRTDDVLQRAYYDAIRNDLSEADRQRAARALVGILKDYEVKGPSYLASPSLYTGPSGSIAPSTPAGLSSSPTQTPTGTVSPSSYVVSGGRTAPQTRTIPPQITATERPQPVTDITPAAVTAYNPYIPPLTSTAPPEIYASAAPVMPSVPVGGYDVAGIAGVRPFNWQSAQIEEMPEIQQRSAQDLMTGQSLAAYQQLMGRGAAQLAPQTFSPVQTVTPYAYTTPTNSPSSPFVVGPSSNTSSPFVIGPSSGTSSYSKPVDTAVLASSLGNIGKVDTPIPQSVAEQMRKDMAKLYGGYADGGAIPGYALGGMGNLGGFSDGGQLLKGPGDGVSDSIPATIGDQRPARLADGEFVVPARIVSELGNGSTDAGARKLYAMLDRVQNARNKTTGKGRVAVNSRADKYLPA